VPGYSQSYVYQDVIHSNDITFATRYSTGELIITGYRDQNQLPPNNTAHQIIAIQNDQIVWTYETNLAYPHGLYFTPQSTLLVADCENDRILEIGYPSKDILREWNVSMVNWTSFFNLPTFGTQLGFNWAHLNDFDFKNYSTWEGMLISLRNINTVIEINWTQFQLTGKTQIVWSYGNPTNSSILYHQHTPRYLANGDIAIADSKNSRIVIVNYTNPTQIQTFDPDLNWVRDAEPLPDGRLLVTDSTGILVFNLTSNHVDWRYGGTLIAPYHAHLVGTDQIAIADQFGGQILLINWNGDILWQFGNSPPLAFFIFNGIMILIVQGLGLFFALTRRQRIGNLVGMGVVIFVLLEFASICNLILNILFLHTGMV